MPNSGYIETQALRMINNVTTQYMLWLLASMISNIFPAVIIGSMTLITPLAEAAAF